MPPFAEPSPFDDVPVPQPANAETIHDSQYNNLYELGDSNVAVNATVSNFLIPFLITFVTFLFFYLQALTQDFHRGLNQFPDRMICESSQKRKPSASACRGYVINVM